MPVVRVAAVQASCVLMDKRATLDKVSELTAKAAALGAQLVVFPEVFVPGTPIWIDTRPIWDGDEDWFRLLAENAVVVPGPETPCCTSRQTASCRSATASWSPLAPSGPCGGWVMAQRSGWWTRNSAGSEA